MYEIILLVEDDHEDQVFTLRAVRKYITQAVVVARDGAEALDFLFGTGDYEGCDLSISPSLVLLTFNSPSWTASRCCVASGIAPEPVASPWSFSVLPPRSKIF